MRGVNGGSEQEIFAWPSRGGWRRGESEQKVQSWKFTFIIHILT